MAGFLLEGGLEAGLVGYGAGDAMDGGRGNEIFPVVVVVGSGLVVESGGDVLGVEQVEGVGGGEEVIELLVFHVAEQRGAIAVIVRGGVVEEVVGEGVWTGLVSARSGGDGGS